MLADQQPPQAGIAPDPAFQSIAEHRAAYQEWQRAAEAENNTPLDAPGYAEAEAAAAEPSRRECAAFDAVLDCRPTSLAGVLALAEYLPGAIRDVSPDPDETDGERGLRSVAAALREILQSGGDASAEKPADAMNDLSACSLRELARLYESLLSVQKHLSDTVNTPCFWKATENNPNAAGRLLEAEDERLAQLLGAIAREAKARQATTLEDRDERLFVLVQDELLCSGRIVDQAIIAELVSSQPEVVR